MAWTTNPGRSAAELRTVKDELRWAVGVAVSASGHALGPYTKLGGPVLCGGAEGNQAETGGEKVTTFHADEIGGGSPRRQPASQLRRETISGSKAASPTAMGASWCS